MLTFHGCINYEIILIIITKGKFALPKHVITIMISGIFN